MLVKVPQSHRVAVLIDADNSQLEHLEQIIRIASYYGILTICRAYGDWKKSPLSAWKDKISPLKIETRQVNRVGKDTTDKQLMIEVGEILGADGADVFVIVSGDGDFRLLYIRIKEKGKKVIGIGNKGQTSKTLRKSCNTFCYIENLEQELNTLEKSRTSEFEKLLKKAIRDIPRNKEGWVDLGPLGMKLRELALDFEGRFGYKKLSEWIRSLNEHFETQNQLVRRIDNE